MHSSQRSANKNVADSIISKTAVNKKKKKKVDTAFAVLIRLHSILENTYKYSNCLIKLFFIYNKNNTIQVHFNYNINNAIISQQISELRKQKCLTR